MAHSQLFTSLEGTIKIPAWQIFMPHGLVERMGAIPALPPAFPSVLPSWVADRAVRLWDKAVKGGGGSWVLSFLFAVPSACFGYLSA